MSEDFFLLWSSEKPGLAGRVVAYFVVERQSIANIAAWQNFARASCT